MVRKQTRGLKTIAGPENTNIKTKENNQSYAVLATPSNTEETKHQTATLSLKEKQLNGEKTNTNNILKWKENEPSKESINQQLVVPEYPNVNEDSLTKFEKKTTTDKRMENEEATESIQTNKSKNHTKKPSWK